LQCKDTVNNTNTRKRPTASFFYAYLFKRVATVFVLLNWLQLKPNKKNSMAFKDIFKKSNDYNEKTVVGFLSFAVMTLVMIVDLVTGYLGQVLPLNDYVFNAFMYITLGSFGIAGLEKFAPSARKEKETTEE